MPTLFISEIVLAEFDLSERDFLTEILTDDQKRRLDYDKLLDGFDKTKQISVKRESTRHGITVSQSE